MRVKAERVGESAFWFDVDASDALGLLRFGREFGFYFDIDAQVWSGQVIDCGEMYELEEAETAQLVDGFGLSAVVDWFGEHPEAKSYSQD